MAELILELFSEEIPARMQAKAAADLGRMVVEGLAAAGLPKLSSAAYATPRRLALHVAELPMAAAAVREELKGPRVDAPPAALEGFLRKTGLTREQLGAKADKKGEVYIGVVETPARATAEILAELVPDVVRRFPWPKSMRWGAGELRWVRPLRGVLCVLVEGDAITVPDFEIGGLRSGDVAYGHRFMAPAPFKVGGFAQYVEALAEAFVTLDPAARKAAIAAGAAAEAAMAGLDLVDDAALLDEVAGLVEHPVVLSGAIGVDFQALPPEVLTTSMREHQKFFALRDPADGRIKRFVTVANIAAADGGAAIIAGNERVLTARLSDARFFYQNDLARPLETRLEALAAVTFHNQLGSQADRVDRIEGLARALAPAAGAAEAEAARAARLAKADLATEMVYEFPELQGLMGRYYAEAGGEPSAVAQAIEAHYAPLGPSDAVPAEPTAIAVALADKLDQLAGFWAIDAKPTGSGDPFALRRAALGVIRILLENRVRLSLAAALAGHAGRLDPHLKPAEEGGAAPRFDAAAQGDLVGFIAERLKVYLRGLGARHDVVDAVYALGPVDDLVDARARIDAVGALIAGEDGPNLLAAFKRANNILAAERAKDGAAFDAAPSADAAVAAEERALFAALDAAEVEIGPALEAQAYEAAMGAMARLRGPLDAFFEGVVVNAEDADLRRNRLRLLHRLTAIMGRAADFSALEG